MALKDAHGGAAGRTGSRAPLRREPAALASWRAATRADAIDRYHFAQFLFFRQWSALRRDANARGHPHHRRHARSSSRTTRADVWANPQLFQLDADGAPDRASPACRPTTSARPGQLWGNPHLRLGRDGRTTATPGGSRACARRSSWSTSCASTTSAASRPTGRSRPASRPRSTAAGCKGPGAALLRGAQRPRSATVPIVAEDLGVITPEVEALRERFGFPGMRILQFAFGDRSENRRSCRTTSRATRVVYTGTHDNDTTVGWWESTGAGDSTRAADEVAREKAFALAVSRRRRPRDELDAHSRRARVRREHGDHPAAGRARTRQRSAHEPSRSSVRELALSLLVGSDHSRDRRTTSHDDRGLRALAIPSRIRRPWPKRSEQAERTRRRRVPDDLEHELRVPGHPVRLGAADGEHERHLRVSRRARGSDPDALARGAAHRTHRPADHRSPERSHLVAALGRRRPFFLVGAILASIALLAMPTSSALWMAAGCCGSSTRRSTSRMEPFRAFVADLLPTQQRTRGFAMQSLFIGLGAVIASAMPWMLTNWFGVGREHAGHAFRRRCGCRSSSAPRRSSAPCCTRS